ncbi:MAG: hypothetical protein HQL20_02355 [Candidatus Omnitrophica bacterium]|nr:hypothetical protein [Candidatus Omnitrophota bacterium]
MSIQSFFDALFYDRTRHFYPGNPELFRPLFFLVLTVQRLWFKYNFFYWQLVSLLAHLLTVFALWRLLHRWSDNFSRSLWSIVLFTIFFSFLFVNMEAVIWHHITPYVLFAGFVLFALERLDVFVVSGGHDTGALGVCSLWLLAGVLTYEVGLWYILCFFIYSIICLKGSGKASRSWVLLTPFFIYVLWSAGHWLAVHKQFVHNEGVLFGVSCSGNTLVNFFLILRLFLLGGFFLLPSDVIPDLRLCLGQEFFSLAWPLNIWLPFRCVGAVVFVSVIILSFVGIWQIKLYVKRKMVFLLLAMLAGYVLMIVVGRFNVRSYAGISNSVYYFYNFWVLFVLILFLLFQHYSAVLNSARLPLLMVLTVSIISFSLCNAFNIYSYTSLMKNESLLPRVYLRALDKFVSDHKKEKDFSFYFSPDDQNSINLPLEWGIKGEASGTKHSVTELLYPQYFTDRNPKYRLDSETWQKTGYF